MLWRRWDRRVRQVHRRRTWSWCQLHWYGAVLWARLSVEKLSLFKNFLAKLNYLFGLFLFFVWVYRMEIIVWLSLNTKSCVRYSFTTWCDLVTFINKFGRLRGDAGPFPAATRTRQLRHCHQSRPLFDGSKENVWFLTRNDAQIRFSFLYCCMFTHFPF